MNIGAIILCRYNSSRLPGKILKEIRGKTILQHIVDRLGLVNGLKIIVATSEESTDDIIEDYCDKNNIPCYRGSLQNVAERFLNAGQSQDLDYAIRINGDNLFINLENLEDMIAKVRSNPIDFYSNVRGRTFPYGMSIEILNLKFYQDLMVKINNEYYREHVTIYLYENEDIGKRKYFYNNAHPEVQGKRLAIDEKEDLQQAEKILSLLGDRYNNYTFEELIMAIAKSTI